MNEQTHEHLSMLMDGELGRDQMRFLLKRAGADGAFAQRWARYHVARQVLRRHDLLQVSNAFADSVMARLHDAPVLQTQRNPAWLRWGSGAAIAASVAVAALMLTRPTDTSMDTLPPAARTASQPATAVGAAALATTATTMPSGFQPPLLAPNTPTETAPASFGTDLAEPIATDPRLQSYLIRHYQAAGATGQSNLVPYVLLGLPQRETLEQPVRPNR